jgi:hypothetical protein
MILDPALALTLALLLAAIFAAAAIAKLRGVEVFAGMLANYRLLPDALVQPLAYLLPIVELGTALHLLLPATRPAAAVVAVLLLLLFAAAMAVNLARGRRDIDCGCFVGRLRQRLSWPLVARNLLLAAGAVLLAAAETGGRALGVLDGVTVAAALGSLLLLYAAGDRLFGLAPSAPKGAS